MQMIENDIVLIRLPRKIEHNIIYEINIINYPIRLIIIDFKDTSYVTLSGLMYLICFIAFLNKENKDLYSITTYCELINLKENILNILMNFGFFEQMVSKGNLFRVNNVDILMNRALLEEEKRYVNHQIQKSKSENKTRNLILPISTIITGGKKYYETYVGNFRNRFSDFYEKMVNLGFFSFSLNSEEDYKREFSNFSNAIFEISKNIYDHSNSWGLGAIHARENGIEIAYYDIGDGIAKSMKSCTEYAGISDLIAIKTAFIDGKSSKSENGNNKGRGFTKMLDFTQKRNGYFSVRTGNYHFRNGKEKEINWFPGTQIVIFIPN